MSVSETHWRSTRGLQNEGQIQASYRDSSLTKEWILMLLLMGNPTQTMIWKLITIESALGMIQFRKIYSIYYNVLFRSSADLSVEYKHKREGRVNEILQFSEYEQIDFVRTLMQHMSHYQLGVLDTQLQVLYSYIITTRYTVLFSKKC